MTFYRDLKPDKRKQVKEKLMTQLALRKQSIKIFDDAFIKPQRELVLLTDKVLKNEVPIEWLLQASERWEKFVDKFTVWGDKPKKKATKVR